MRRNSPYTSGMRLSRAAGSPARHWASSPVTCCGASADTPASLAIASAFRIDASGAAGGCQTAEPILAAFPLHASGDPLWRRSGETPVQANTRLAVTSAALGTVVVVTLASVGCNDPASDALSSALKPPTSKYSVGGSVSGLSGGGLV